MFQQLNNIYFNMKKFNKEIINGVTFIDGYLIVNKQYSLPKNYGNGLTKELKVAFFNMQNAALKENIELKIISGFRSYERQKEVYESYLKIDSKKSVDTYSARPGHSEHQSGLAIDINKDDDSFIDTKEARWLDNNAYKYGFILRYPEGKSEITGYKYEPWHYRYVGEYLAKKLYNNGDWITIEEYFKIQGDSVKVADIPKIVLHLHLDGSIDIDDAYDWAKEDGFDYSRNEIINELQVK